MVIKLKKAFAIQIMFLLVVLPAFAQDKDNLASTALAFVKKIDKDARDLSLHAAEIYNLRLITANRIFRVSTADTIPFRNWFIVIDGAGVPSKYEYNDLKKFNLFTAQESIKLKTMKDFYSFIEVFITLAIEGESLLQDNFRLNRDKIRDEFKNLAMKSKVMKNPKGFYRLIFFTSDATGNINMWRLNVTDSGQVKKLNKVSITYE